MQSFNQADPLIRHIIARTDGKIRLALPLGLGKPNTIVNALTQAAVDDPAIDLQIFTALTLERPTAASELEQRFLNPAKDRLFGEYPSLLYARLLHQKKLPKNIHVCEFFLQAGNWLGNEAVQSAYIAANYTHALDFLLQRRPNVLAQLVAENGHGGYSLSCNTDISTDLLAARRCGDVDFLMVAQTNCSLPYMTGEAAEIDHQQIDLLLTGPENEFELFSVVKEPVTIAEHAIGLHVSALVRDGGTLQIGIGSLGDAVAQALLLRHHDSRTYQHLSGANPFPSSSVPQHQDPFAIGLYASTEMLVDGLLQLYEGGVIKREVEGAVIHAGFFVESRSFYKRLREMNSSRRDKIVMKPVTFTNQIYGDEHAKRQARQHARFVNSAMIATLNGAVVSDGTGNGQVVSGVGGQFNFVTQAFALKNARSILAVKATRYSKGNLASNIVWSYPHTTIPRHLKDIVATEYGIADLRGKSDADTIKAMLAISDSRFQPELLAKAKSEGKIEKSYELPASSTCNTPERLHDWLASFRKQEVLNPFPFGSDFDDTERRLLPALGLLKRLQSNRIELMRIAWAGLTAPDSSATQKALTRMSLQAPASVRDRMYSVLLRGALHFADDKD